MKVDDVVKILNENQGVMAAIPVIGGIIFWFFRIRKKDKTSADTQSITIIGSGNYVEGKSINSDVQLSDYVSNPAVKIQNSAHVVCVLSKLKLPKIGSCFMFEFLNGGHTG